jgi:hypothetical protein
MVLLRGLLIEVNHRDDNDVGKFFHGDSYPNGAFVISLAPDSVVPVLELVAIPILFTFMPSRAKYMQNFWKRDSTFYHSLFSVNGELIAAFFYTALDDLQHIFDFRFARHLIIPTESELQRNVNHLHS